MRIEFFYGDGKTQAGDRREKRAEEYFGPNEEIGMES